MKDATPLDHRSIRKWDDECHAFILDEGIGKPEDGESVYSAKGYTMSVQVVTVANRIPDRTREPYYRLDMFRKSAERHGIVPTVLGLNEPWGGLMTTPRRLRQWLRAGGCTAGTLIFCDAFDIVFTAPAEMIAETYRTLWAPELVVGGVAPIVFNAEKGLFPRGELEAAFEKVPGPWKYLNGGFFIGSPPLILGMLEAMWLDDTIDDRKAEDDLHGGAGRWINPNYQGILQLMFGAQVFGMHLDFGCRLCQSLSACTLDEFDLSGDSIKNVITGATPLVFHFNGGSKNDLMPIFLKKLGLE